MPIILTPVLLLLSLAHAATPAPTVTIKDGVVIGTAISSVDNFYGIPYAQAPLNNLRLKPPQAIQTPYGTLKATNADPTACPQAPQSSIPHIGEDCLNLNVIRPSNLTSASKLPVIVFVFGGGFIGGASTLLNGTYFVQQSVRLGQPFVWVGINYRVNGFGFLAGKELTAEGSTNLGLRDQRAAIQWIQSNIAAFGGDPAKVTLWGTSAGSISVFDQTLVNGGDNTYNGKPLFRAAIMSSGSVVPALPSDSQRAQEVFDGVVKGANCQLSSDVLACLRRISYTTLLYSCYTVINKLGYQSFDNAYLPRPDPTSSFFQYSPEDAVVANKYTKLPIIVTDVEDEGTGFVQSANISTTAELIAALTKHFPASTTDDITKLVSAYPDDPAAGSPFRTGDMYNIYPEYKRLAAIYGDTLFTLLRRGYLSLANSQMNTWSSLSSALYGSPLYDEKGTFHSVDVSLLQYEFAGPLVPRDSLLTYFTSFVAFSDPNKIPSSFPVWNKWTSASPQLLNVSYTSVSSMYENFRSSQYQTVISLLSKLKL